MSQKNKSNIYNLVSVKKKCINRWKRIKLLSILEYNSLNSKSFEKKNKDFLMCIILYSIYTGFFFRISFLIQSKNVNIVRLNILIQIQTRDIMVIYELSGWCLLFYLKKILVN
jgi:hypothetical protein